MTLEKIKALQRELKMLNESLRTIEEIEMRWETIEWGDFCEPHHFSIEVPRVYFAMERRRDEIEYNLERI